MLIPLFPLSNTPPVGKMPVNPKPEKGPVYAVPNRWWGSDNSWMGTARETAARGGATEERGHTAQVFRSNPKPAVGGRLRKKKRKPPPRGA